MFLFLLVEHTLKISLRKNIPMRIWNFQTCITNRLPPEHKQFICYCGANIFQLMKMCVGSLTLFIWPNICEGFNLPGQQANLGVFHI